MVLRDLSKELLNHKVLYCRVVRSAITGDLDDILRVLLEALAQAERVKNPIRRWAFLSELNEKYHFFLMHPEIKDKYGQLLHDGDPTLEDMKTYDGYDLYLKSWE